MEKQTQTTEAAKLILIKKISDPYCSLLKQWELQSLEFHEQESISLTLKDLAFFPVEEFDHNFDFILDSFLSFLNSNCGVEF